METAVEQKCPWCGKLAYYEVEPFLIQGKLFCSQAEFAEYVDNTFSQIVESNGPRVS